MSYIKLYSDLSFLVFRSRSFWTRKNVIYVYSNISNDCIISSFSRGLFKTQMTYVKVRTKSTRVHYILWIQKLFQTLWLRLKSWISSGVCLKFVLQLSCIIHTSKSFNVYASLTSIQFNSLHRYVINQLTFFAICVKLSIKMIHENWS